MKRKVPIALRWLPLVCVIASIGILGTLAWSFEKIEQSSIEPLLMEAHAPGLKKQAEFLLKNLHDNNGTPAVPKGMMEDNYTSPSSGRYWQLSDKNSVILQRSPSLGDDAIPTGGWEESFASLLVTIFTVPLTAITGEEGSQSGRYLATAHFRDKRVERLLVVSLKTKVSMPGREPQVFEVRVAENTAPFMEPFARIRNIALTVTTALLVALIALSVLAQARARKTMRHAPSQIEDKA